jgi:integrase
MVRQADSEEAINQRLKAADIRLRVVVRNRKLSLRGTLPPRPGETKPKQTYLSLGLDATPYGYRMAEMKAHEVWSQLGQGKFSWEHWVDAKDWQTCQAWIDRYKRHWFKRKGDTEESQRKWHRGEWLLGLRWLPPEENLTAELLEQVAQSKPPNTRARQRLVQILTHLAEFAEISVDLSLYKGNYSCAKSQPREIPTDPEILVTRNKITNLQWRLVFDRMAVYGLRDHECWHCEIDLNPPHACRVLVGKTGSREGVLPLYPEWAAEWKPWEGELPTVNAKDRAIFGERTARAFKRLGLPFTPYNLRHAWNIRGSVVFKIPVAVMARMAGHSAEVHLRVYSRWLSKAQSLEAYSRAITAKDRPLAPVIE